MTLEQTIPLYFCQDCKIPFTKFDIGSQGKTIYSFHEKKGCKIILESEREKTILELAQDVHLSLDNVKKYYASLKEDIFNEITSLLEKEVKDENENIIQVAITIFSAFTKTPQNLRILAQSGEGKTYIVNKVSNLFPQEDILPLANATPQAFKYRATKEIVEVSPGNWLDYSKVLENEGLGNIQYQDMTPEQKARIKEIKENTWAVCDFTNKTIIFLDNQSFNLWESLKTTLSHDREYSKYLATNKSKSGQATTNNIVFKGWPAVIYCSAKDEIDQDKTDEINTRFNTVSIKGDAKKYESILKFKAINTHLPDHIYQKKIISEEQINKVKENIQKVIEQIKTYAEIEKPIMNFYAEEIASQFQKDAGYRARQLDTLLSNITVLTLANARARPKLIIEGQEYPIVIRSDIERANKLVHELNPLPATKIQFFNKYIRPAYTSALSGSLTALQIVDYINKTAPQLGLDRKKLRERYLDGFVDHGFMESSQDPNNASRFTYTITERYQTKAADLDTSLFVTSDIADSCVNIFKEKWLSDVSNWKIKDQDGNEILSSDQDVIDDSDYEKNQLITLLTRNVTPTPKTESKNQVTEVTFSDVSGVPL